MKLWILLDENINIKNVKENDIILSNNFDILKRYNIQNKFIVNWSICDEDPSVFQSINDFFLDINENYEIYKNNMYMLFFRPITALITHVNNLIKEFEINEIILVGGSEKEYIFLDRAEGEGEKWFYKSSWLFNPILYKILKGKKVVWLKKESKYKNILKYIFREKIIFLRMVISEIYRNFKYKKENEELILKQNQNTIFVIVPLYIQYKHLKNILKSKEFEKNIIYLTSKIKEVDNKNIILIKPMKIKKLFRELIKLKGKISEKDFIKFKWQNLDLTIKSKDLKKAFIPTKISLLTLKENLEKNIEILKKFNLEYIITNMTFGETICLCHKCSKEAKIKHINFQYVNMNKMLFPQFELADKYYMFSKKTCDLYQNYSKIYEYYLPIEKNENRIISNKIVVSIFLQPDLYAKRYIIFLESFLKKLEKENREIEVLIKPHYRQNDLVKFKELVKNYNFAKIMNTEENVRNIILNSDFILSMTSSVLFEAFLVGVPGIIIDIDGEDSELINNNDGCVEEVNFKVKNLETVMEIIFNKEIYLKRYEENREKFLYKINAITDINKIII